MPNDGGLRLSRWAIVVLEVCAMSGVMLAAATSISQAQFDAGFKDRAMGHVRYLAALGNRVTGSGGLAIAEGEPQPRSYRVCPPRLSPRRLR